MNMKPLGGRRKVPNGWRLATLDEIKSSDVDACRAGPFGSSISQKFFIDSGIPVIRGNNLSTNLTEFIPSGFVFVSEERARQKYKNCIVRPGDLVFTCWGTIGQVGHIPSDGPFDEYVISNKQLKLRVDQSAANSKFVYYYLASKEGVEYLASRSIGGAVPGINLGILKSVQIALPPIRQQADIVRTLAAYDDLIDNNRRRIQLLERAARLLYNEWFVHLRFPGHEHTKTQNGIPEGWEKKLLNEIAHITMGQSPQSFYYNEDGNGLPFHQGVTNFGVRFPTHQTYCTIQGRLAESGDILFSVRAPVGRINITKDKIVIGRGLAAIRSKLGQQNLLFYALKSHFFKEDMIGGGAIFAAITKKDLYSVELLQAPDSVAEMFMEHVRPIDSQIENLHRTIDQLAKARDLLLPRLMNGEISV